MAKREEKRDPLRSLHGARAGQRPTPRSPRARHSEQAASRKPQRPRRTFEHQVFEAHAQQSGAGRASAQSPDLLLLFN